MKVNNVETLFNETLKQSKLSEKQQAVLKVSLNLFAEQGFDRTTTSQIAIQAGVSEGTVFKQFKTKDGILQALLSPFIDQVVPRAAVEFTSEIDRQQFTNLRDLFEYIFEDRLTFAMTNQKQLIIFVQEIIRDSNLVTVTLGKVESLVTGTFGRALQQFKADGQLVNWPTTRIVRYFVGILGSYALPQVLLQTTTPMDVKKSSREAAEFLAKGLTPLNEK